MAKDLFSKQAADYAQYRPGYPEALFEYILSFVQQRRLAWDCATGNGQAAIALAGYFDQVQATDISEKQLEQAVAHARVSYSASAAEETDFPSAIFDCITVAQAYHWFNFDAFHKEVLRVAKPGAVIAVWGYSLVVCEQEAVNTQIGKFYRDVIGPYWDAERKHIDAHYSTVAFPYEELPGKEFKIEVAWNRNQLEGYLNTWSAVQHYIKAKGVNPVTSFIAGLPNAGWRFYFPLFLKIGRVQHPSKQ